MQYYCLMHRGLLHDRPPTRKMVEDTYNAGAAVGLHSLPARLG